MAQSERGELTDQLPSSQDSERSVLGAIMLDNGCLSQADGLLAEHFSLDSHRRIYRAMLDMWADGVAIDIVTLSEELRSRVDREGSALDKVGGAAYLSSLTDGVPPRANIQHYVNRVLRSAQQRELYIIAHRVMVAAIEPDANVPKILEDVQAKTMKLFADYQAKDVEMFLPATEFVKFNKGPVEWRVERIIEKGTNGVIQALPKTGKSMMTCYLAVCLATGIPFFDLDVQRCHVALVSREDYAGTTARRLRQIFKGVGMDPEQNIYGKWLYVNTRAQTKTLMLDNPRDLSNLIQNLKRYNAEFVILDVLNVLHGAKENDSTEMTVVLNRLKTIHAETGAQVCLVHHVRKGAGESSISERGRGSNAISGFAEFIVDLDMADEEKEIRQASFLTKGSGRYKPFHWNITDLEGDGGIKLERCQYETSTAKRRAAKA